MLSHVDFGDLRPRDGKKEKGHLQANLKPSWTVLEASVAILVAGFGVVEVYMCQYRWNHGEVQFVS